MLYERRQRRHLDSPPPPFSPPAIPNSNKQKRCAPPLPVLLVNVTLTSVSCELKMSETAPLGQTQPSMRAFRKVTNPPSFARAHPGISGELPLSIDTPATVAREKVRLMA